MLRTHRKNKLKCKTSLFQSHPLSFAKLAASSAWRQSGCGAFLAAKNSDFFQHYPGRINVEMANVIIVDHTTAESQLQKIRTVNPQAHIIQDNIEQQIAALLI